MEKIEKTFSFGKAGRKPDVDVFVRLYDRGDGRPVLGISGGIWNRGRTDYWQCGQCLDEIAKRVKDPVFKKIYGWWKDFHNNDMHPGTPEQEEYLEKHRTWSGDYDKDCECLERAGLLTVDLDGKPYTYGRGWLYRPIPDGVVAEIKALLEGGAPLGEKPSRPAA